MSSPIPLYRPRDNMWCSYRSSTANSSTASSPSSLHPPPPPPPSPCDSSLDITPRKTSFSMSSGRSISCAFPSWPNRTALFSDSESESASSYLSDEDLCFTPCPTEYGSPVSSAAILEEDEDEPESDPTLSTEEQMRLMNSDNERRLRYLAQMHAQARAQQAQRAAQQLAAEVGGNAKRRKRRVGGDKKRRTASASSSTSSSAASNNSRLAA